MFEQQIHEYTSRLGLSIESDRKSDYTINLLVCEYLSVAIYTSVGLHFLVALLHDVNQFQLLLQFRPLRCCTQMKRHELTKFNSWTTKATRLSVLFREENLP